MRHLFRFLIASCILFMVQNASAVLYTSNYGTLLPNSSNCDDCFDGPIAFPGSGQSISFFGSSYPNLYVGSNGYVTFGSGQTGYTSSPLNVQTLAPMIAGLFTDLWSNGSALSNVYANTDTPGQIVVTWERMDLFPTTGSGPATFQLVIRSSQFVVPPGEGQIGFYYGPITLPATTASAGFGDGLAAVNPGEVAFFSGNPNTMSNAATQWYSLSSTGVPITSATAPIPTLSEWSMIILSALLALGTFVVMRRKQV